MLLLAGCNGSEEEPTAGPEPTTVEPSEPDTATEEEPSAGPEEYPLPERPEAMDHDDLDGAEAAGIFFVELLYYAMGTGDLELWEKMSAETCDFCSSASANIAGVYDDGGWFETEPPQFGDVSTHLSTDERGGYYFEAHVSDPPITQFESDGTVALDDPGGQLESRLLLTHAENGWLVGAFEAEEHGDDN